MIVRPDEREGLMTGQSLQRRFIALCMGSVLYAVLMEVGDALFRIIAHR
jgi:hypothetical protein